MYPALFVLALEGVSDAERASVVGTISSFFDASQGLGAFDLRRGRRGRRATAARSSTGAVAALFGLVLLRTRTS